MTYRIFKKLGAAVFSMIILFSCSSFAFAQSELTSPLDSIKAKLDEEGINVIDYSAEVWGQLPDRIVEALIDSDYEGLSEMYFGLNDLVEGALENEEKMAEAIEMLREELLLAEYVDEDDELATLSNDDIDLILNEMSAYQYSGERQIRDIVMTVVEVVRNLIGVLAVIWIIISGIRMITASGDESVITEQKRSITWAIVGLIVIIIIERMVTIIYGAPGEIRTVLIPPTEAFDAEVYGIINFIKAIIGAIAIFMIVISGVKTITAGGDEEKIKKQRTAVIWVIAGLILIAIDKVIVENIFILPVQQADQISTSNVTTIINYTGRIMQFVLGFVGLIALGALIYGAGNMIANYGNDEMVQKSKKIIKNAIIGIIVIISAYTIIATLVVFK